jgi:membrane protein DedA with SNARE-associated domain
MLDALASHLDSIAALAPVWGFLFVFIFMTIESSFIPLPSEVVMIPAGFLAARGEMLTGNVWIDCILAIVIGTTGSLAGAYINYYLALYLGRTALHKYGKYFFLKEETILRAEEVFREYGAAATFICRLLPAIRQLISIPAGLAKMPLASFTLFTGLGAGIWVVILTAIGAWLGHLSGDMDYPTLINKGKQLISDHYIWIIVSVVVFGAVYLFIHKRVMKLNAPKED